MNIRLCSSLGATALLTFVLAACGKSPTAPPPPPPPPSPVNAAPVIESVRVQTRRAGVPASFADVGDTMDVTATVTDAETPVDQLVYQWSAPTGTFEGSGRAVRWIAPSSAETPATVTLTLRVIETYGNPGQTALKHEITATATVRLHDSRKEVGDMARRFLTEFSKPQANQNIDDIMKDFSESRCPQISEVRDERDQVIAHYTNFVMVDYVVGPASVNLQFGGACAFRGALGDACAVVPVYWNSTDKRTGVTSSTSGLDHLAAVYAAADSRWWLCSSQYEHLGSFTGNAFYSR